MLISKLNAYFNIHKHLLSPQLFYLTLLLCKGTSWQRYEFVRYEFVKVRVDIDSVVSIDKTKVKVDLSFTSFFRFWFWVVLMSKFSWNSRFCTITWKPLNGFFFIFGYVVSFDIRKVKFYFDNASFFHFRNWAIMSKFTWSSCFRAITWKLLYNESFSYLEK